MTSWLVERILLIGTGSRNLAESITGDLLATRRSRVWLLLAACGIAFRYSIERLSRLRDHRPSHHRTRRSANMNTLWLDLRYALRGLRKSPGFTTIVIATIALGVGANVAIYSLVHAIMLAPLPYPQQDDIVRIWPGESVTMGWVLTFQDAKSFSVVAGVTGARATMTGQGEPMELEGGGVTASHFDVIGVRPALGRPFHQDDHRPSAEPVVILTHALWQRAFAGDSSVVGTLVDIAEGAGRRPRVVGVMPA